MMSFLVVRARRLSSFGNKIVDLFKTVGKQTQGHSIWRLKSLNYVVTVGGSVMIVNFIHDSEVKCVVGDNLREMILRFELNRWITTAAKTTDSVVLLIP